MVQRAVYVSRFLFAALLIAASAAHAQLEQCVELPLGTATINGTVKSQETSAPMMATLSATADFGGISQSFGGGVGLDGAYTIQVAAPATYIVAARPFDSIHAPEIYDGVTTNAAATEISVVPGQVVNDIDFTLIVGATLSGTVTAQGSGDPLEGVSVQALGSGDLVSPSNFATTDESGDYTITGLVPGTYQVTFVPFAGDYLLELFDDNLGFPGDPVNVPQEGATGVDAALSIGGRIEGTVTGAGAGALDGATVTAIPEAGGYAFGSASTDVDGNYSLLVASGSYKIFVSPENLISQDAPFVGEYYNDAQNVNSADAVIVTAPQTTADIDVELAPSGAISGRVTDADTSDGIEGVAVEVYSTAGVFIAGTTTGFNGNYLVNSNLASGQYKVGFVGPAPDFEGGVGYADAFYADKQTLNSATHVQVTAPNETQDIDQALVPCDQLTTTTTGGVTTTVPETTTTSIGGGTTTTVPGQTTTTLPGETTTTLPGETTTTLPGETTTTTNPSTTTTTLDGGERPCGDPVALTADAVSIDSLAPNGVLPRAISASDALFALRSAVGSETCELCVCDVNDAGGVTATDALIILRRAVGSSVDLLCPVCG